MSRSAASMILGSLSGVAIGVALSIGCGGSDNPGVTATCTGDCECVGSTCSCKQGGNCTMGGAADDSGLSDAGAGPANVTYKCESRNTCTSTCSTGCTSSCSGQSTCNQTCTSNCTSTCTGTSNCNISTGTNSTVTCGGGASCTVTVDTGSTVSCTGNSSCNISCPKGGCTADCQGSTGCTVVCGGTAACTITCNGGKKETCAAGSTCAPCGGGAVGDGGDDGGRGKP